MSRLSEFLHLVSLSVIVLLSLFLYETAERAHDSYKLGVQHEGKILLLERDLESWKDTCFRLESRERERDLKKWLDSIGAVQPTRTYIPLKDWDSERALRREALEREIAVIEARKRAWKAETKPPEPKGPNGGKMK